MVRHFITAQRHGTRSSRALQTFSVFKRRSILPQYNTFHGKCCIFFYYYLGERKVGQEWLIGLKMGKNSRTSHANASMKATSCTSLVPLFSASADFLLDES